MLMSQPEDEPGNLTPLIDASLLLNIGGGIVPAECRGVGCHVAEAIDVLHLNPRGDARCLIKDPEITMRVAI